MPTIKYINKKGEKVIGTTTFLTGLGWSTRPLMWWSWDCGKRGIDYKDMAKDAADSGTLCHYLCTDFYLCDLPLNEKYVAQFTEEQQKKAWQGLESFKLWFINNRLDIYKAEISLVSEEYQYGLTPDVIARSQNTGELTLIDLKTGKGPYESHLIQLEAYKRGWEENFPDEPITGGYHLLRIGKEDASFHHHFWQELPEEAWQIFIRLIYIYNGQKILKNKL